MRFTRYRSRRSGVRYRLAWQIAAGTDAGQKYFDRRIHHEDSMNTMQPATIEVMAQAMELGHTWVQAVLSRADESDHGREVCELIASGANVAITFPIAQLKGAVEVHATRPDGTRMVISSESFELQAEG
jgi:hypothetical protein